MVDVLHIFDLQCIPINHNVFNTPAIVINSEILLNIEYAIQPKGDINNTLIGVALHEAEDEFIVDVPDVLKISDLPLGQFLPVNILNQDSKLSHLYS
jgi:hypothetical protein